MIVIAYNLEIYNILLSICTCGDFGGIVLVVKTVFHRATYCTTRHDQFLSRTVIDETRYGCRQRDTGHSSYNTELSCTAYCIITTVIICDSHCSRSCLQIVWIADCVFRSRNLCFAVLYRDGWLLFHAVVDEVRRIQYDLRLIQCLRTNGNIYRSRITVGVILVAIHHIIHRILLGIGACRNLRAKGVLIQAVLHRTTLGTACRDQRLSRTIIHKTRLRLRRHHTSPCQEDTERCSSVDDIVASILTINSYLARTYFDIICILNGIFRGGHHYVFIFHRHCRLLRRSIEYEWLFRQFNHWTCQCLRTNRYHQRLGSHALMIIIAYHLEIHGIFLGISTSRNVRRVSLIIKTVFHRTTSSFARSNQFLGRSVIDETRLHFRECDTSYSSDNTETNRTADDIVTILLIRNRYLSCTHSSIVRIADGVFCWRNRRFAINNRYGWLLFLTIIGKACRSQDDCRLVNSLRTDGYRQRGSLLVRIVTVALYPIINLIHFSLQSCRNLCGERGVIETVLHRSSFHATGFQQLLLFTIIYQVFLGGRRSHVGIGIDNTERFRTVDDIVATILIRDDCHGRSYINIIGICDSIFRGVHQVLAVFHSHIRRFLLTVIYIGCRSQRDDGIAHRFRADGNHYRSCLLVAMVLVTLHPVKHRILLGIRSRWNLRGIRFIVEAVLHGTASYNTRRYQLLGLRVIDQSRLGRRRCHSSTGIRNTEVGCTADIIVTALVVCDGYHAGSHILIVRISDGIFRGRDDDITILHCHDRFLRRSVINERRGSEHDLRIRQCLWSDGDINRTHFTIIVVTIAHHFIVNGISLCFSSCRHHRWVTAATKTIVHRATRGTTFSNQILILAIIHEVGLRRRRCDARACRQNCEVGRAIHNIVTTRIICNNHHGRTHVNIIRIFYSIFRLRNHRLTIFYRYSGLLLCAIVSEAWRIQVDGRSAYSLRTNGDIELHRIPVSMISISLYPVIHRILFSILTLRDGCRVIRIIEAIFHGATNGSTCHQQVLCFCIINKTWDGRRRCNGGCLSNNGKCLSTTNVIVSTGIVCQGHRHFTCIDIISIIDRIFCWRDHSTFVSHCHSRCLGRTVVIIDIRIQQNLWTAYWFWLDGDSKCKSRIGVTTDIVMVGIANNSVIDQIILGFRSDKSRSNGSKVRTIGTVLNGSMIWTAWINKFLHIHVVCKVLSRRSRICGISFNNRECRRTTDIIVTTRIVSNNHRHRTISDINVVTIADSVFRGIDHHITVLYRNGRR